MAASASACWAKVTKPKPRERPVPGSVMTMQSITCPNLRKVREESGQSMWVELQDGCGLVAYWEKASRSESLLVPLMNTRMVSKQSYVPNSAVCQGGGLRPRAAGRVG